MYPIHERLQTLRRPKVDPEARRVLIAYSFPDDVWGPLVESFRTLLRHHGIDARVPPTKSGHVSVGLLVDPSDQEVVRAVQIEIPRFRVLGVDLLVGREFGFVSIELDLPDQMSRSFQHLRRLVGPGRIGDFRTWRRNIRPHVSVVTVPLDQVEATRQLLGLLKVGIDQYRPQYIEIMEDYEVKDWIAA
jgi:hypothetical protein